MTPRKALTLRQPWASLVALGVKTIETRSWATSYRGPIVIHAGKAWPADHACTVWAAAAEAGYVWPTHMSNAPWRNPTGQPGIQPPALPLGAVVATARLVDVAPIGGPYDFRTGIVEGDELPPR